MSASVLPVTWHRDRRFLKGWLLAYLLAWVAFWLVALGTTLSEEATTLLFILLLAPYVTSIVYAYRVQRELNKAGYKPGAWQVIVGAILLDPAVVGWLIPISVLWVSRKVPRAGVKAPQSEKERNPMRFGRFVAYWAIAGLLIPVGSFVAFWIVSFFSPSLGAVVILAALRLLLWPTQMIFIGFHGSPTHEILPNVLAIILNVALYGVVGSVVWCIRRVTLSSRS